MPQYMRGWLYLHRRYLGLGALIPPGAFTPLPALVSSPGQSALAIVEDSIEKKPDLTSWSWRPSFLPCRASVSLSANLVGLWWGQQGVTDTEH